MVLCGCGCVGVSRWRGEVGEGGKRGREGENFLTISLHLQEYIACTQVWIEYVAKHFTVSEKKYHNLCLVTKKCDNPSQVLVSYSHTYLILPHSVR